MDGAHKNPTREYPGYTLAELKAAVAAGRGDVARIAREIARRESGESQHFSTTQSSWKD